MSTNDSGMEREETNGNKNKKRRTETKDAHAADGPTRPPQHQQQQPTFEELLLQLEEMTVANEALSEEKEAWKEEKEAWKEEKEAWKAWKEKEGALTVANEKLSVKKMLDDGLPRMRCNEGCKPSMISNELAQEEVTKFRVDYSAYVKAKEKAKTMKTKKSPRRPEKYKFHEPARIKVVAIDKNGLESIRINVKHRDGCLITSALAVEASRVLNGTLPHHNETSPRDYLCHVLNDVIDCCGFTGHFSVVKEATLFSLRPDLIVVMLDGRLFLVAEVKNPQPSSKNAASNAGSAVVFESETVAGQALDYLKVLKQQGMDWPFALLSTYNDSVIVRLPHDTDKYDSIIKQGLKHTSEDEYSATVQSRSTYAHHEEKPRNSPTKDVFYQNLPSILLPTTRSKRDSRRAKNDSSDMDFDLTGNYAVSSPGSGSGSGYDYKGREVVYSQTFDVQQLYQVATLAMECSWTSFHQSAVPNKPLIPKEGDPLKGELCTLYENGFAYETVDIAKVTFNQAPKLSMMQKFHVICQLGQGGSGKALLCSTSSGVLFVAKLFLPKSSSTAYLADDRNDEDAKHLNSKKEEAEEECARWKKLEPRCERYCDCITLNGLPAITMPFFPPVPMERRKEALGPIKSLLEKVARDENLYYNQADLRWRHFGCRWTPVNNMDITLLDLGSMGNKQEKSIDDQVVELENRMECEELPKAKPVIVK